MITLAAQLRTRTEEDAAKIRVYMTPNVVQFVSVLGIGAILAFPDLTRLTAAAALGGSTSARPHLGRDRYAGVANDRHPQLMGNGHRSLLHPDATLARSAAAIVSRALRHLP